MSGDSGKEQTDKNVLHLDEAERLPSASHGLPAVPNTSQAAEVVKQIIEQILANERRRARNEFVRLSVFFIVFLFAILGTGIWFARQLLAQLREERRFTEQSWRMMAGQNDGSLSAVAHPGSAGGFAEARRASSFARSATVDKMADKSAYPAAKPFPPALNREEVAKLEQNIKAVSELLKTKPQSVSASIRDMLQDQQNAIQALNMRLNEAQDRIAGAEPGANTAPEEIKQIDFITAPVAEDVKLRMPIPSL